MSARASAQLGRAVPPATRHSVTVQMPRWEHIEQFCADPRSLVASLQNAYPRMKPHRDIVQLSVATLNHLNLAHQACFLFTSRQSAQACVEYAISPQRDDGADKKPLDPSLITIKSLRAKEQFYAVIFPPSGLSVLATFWITPGVGMSSRFAETNLDHVDKLHEIAIQPDCAVDRSSFESPSHTIVKQRIINYLNRAALFPETNSRVQANDIYFMPTGMASIYKPHTYLSSSPHNGITVLFGMAFMNTVAAFQEFGNSYKFLGLGTSEDLEALEMFLAQEQEAGRSVQAIWAEFPANPVLVAPDLVRLRQLADQFNTLLAIDDTIGSFANIDVLHMSDFMVTSLTKSFNGYADAIAGSVILNPASKHYADLKELFNNNYVPELYNADAEVIELNSRDYLVRSAKLNHNASALVEYLHREAQDVSSPVKRVHYPDPNVNASGTNYAKFMRKPTQEFKPGFGCLFNIEFKDLPGAIAFYDHINIYNGPHLGAPFTLAFAYTMIAYGTRLDWAAEYGLKATQIRVSAGLEDTEELLKIFADAIEIAQQAIQPLPPSPHSETSRHYATVTS